MKIGSRTLTDDDVFVIAEIGANHMGDPDLCEKMIIEAAKCGADAVKLQKRDRSMMTSTERGRPYDNPNSYGVTYGQHRDYLDYFGNPPMTDAELFNAFVRFKAVAEKHGTMLFATPFTEKDVDFLHRLEVPLWKIASCDVTNLPMVLKVAHYGQPTIISTGGATSDDIDRIISELLPVNNNIALLHCVSLYPNEDSDLNLRFIGTLKKRYPWCTVGFSSHHSGLDALKDAVGQGARILEAHFTLNRGWRGTDQGFSLEPRGLAEICSYTKRHFERLGSADKVVTSREKGSFPKKMGKGVYLNTPKKAGEILKLEDLCLKAPAGGVKPYEMDKVVGKALINDCSTGIALEEEMYA